MLSPPVGSGAGLGHVDGNGLRGGADLVLRVAELVTAAVLVVGALLLDGRARLRVGLISRLSVVSQLRPPMDIFRPHHTSPCRGCVVPRCWM